MGAESDLEELLKSLQSQYEEGQKARDEKKKEIKEAGLGLMKSVAAHKKTAKSELWAPEECPGLGCRANLFAMFSAGCTGSVVLGESQTLRIVRLGAQCHDRHLAQPRLRTPQRHDKAFAPLCRFRVRLG